MKCFKYILSLSFTILFLTMLVIATPETDGCITIYDWVGDKTFSDYVESGFDVNILERNVNGFVSSYALTGHPLYPFKSIYYTYEEGRNEVLIKSIDKVLLYGELNIDIEFLKFILKTSNVENLINKYGYYDTIKDYYFVLTSSCASFIIYNFLCIVGEKDTYFYTYSHDDKHEFFNSSEFHEKYSLKDTKIIINGEELKGDFFAKRLNEGFFLPFRAIMEKLGAKIIWTDNNNYRLIYIIYNNRKYFIDIDNYNFCEIRGDEEIYDTYAEFWALSGDIVDEKLIYNDMIMSRMVTFANAKMSYDFENNIVYIN